VHFATSSCNSTKHRSSTTAKNYLSRSRYNAFSNLQLQSRLPGALRHHLCFAAQSRANAFCRNWLQSRIAGASQQIDQRLRSADNGGRFRATPSVPVCYDIFL